MGSVYRAYDTRLQRTVALKFINASSPEMKARLVHEARAQARIDDTRVALTYGGAVVGCTILTHNSLISGNTSRRRQGDALMCDLGPLFLSLTIASGLIVASAAAIIVAAALNAGVFSAPGAPIPMGVAAALATAAAVAVVTAQSRALEFFTCVGSPEACQTDFTNLIESLEAIAAILFVQALAAAAVAAVAWIPWAAQPAMYVVWTALVAQLAFIPVAIAFARTFLDCVNSLGVRQVPNPLVVAGILVILGVLPIIFVSRRRRAAE